MLHAALDSLSAALDWASSHVFSTLLLVVVGTFLVMTVASALAPVPKPAEYQPEQCGDITKQTLRKYDGRDPFLPIYFAVRDEVFDVTKGRDFYGPGEHAAAQPTLLAHMQPAEAMRMHNMLPSSDVSRTMLPHHLLESQAQGQIQAQGHKWTHSRNLRHSTCIG